MFKTCQIIVVLLFSALLSGCIGSHSAFTGLDTSEKAYDAISFSVCADRNVEMMSEIHNLAMEHGFKGLQNHEVERLVGNNQNRIVVDISYVKNSHVGVWLSNTPVSGRFALLTFKSAFGSDNDYEKFRMTVIDTIRKYNGCGEVGFTVIRGVPVRPAK